MKKIGIRSMLSRKLLCIMITIACYEQLYQKFFIKAKINVQYYIDGKICCRKNVIGVSHSKKNSYKKKDSLVAPKKYRQHFLNSNSMNISVCETSS